MVWIYKQMSLNNNLTNKNQLTIGIDNSIRVQITHHLLSLSKQKENEKIYI